MDRRANDAYRARDRSTLSKLSLLKASIAADRAWMTEVIALFGERNSGMARFQERANGEPGTRLRELYDAYVAARDAYQSVQVSH